MRVVESNYAIQSEKGIEIQFATISTPNPTTSFPALVVVLLGKEEGEVENQKPQNAKETFT